MNKEDYVSLEVAKLLKEKVMKKVVNMNVVQYFGLIIKYFKDK